MDRSANGPINAQSHQLKRWFAHGFANNSAINISTPKHFVLANLIHTTPFSTVLIYDPDSMGNIFCRKNAKERRKKKNRCKVSHIFHKVTFFAAVFLLAPWLPPVISVSFSIFHHFYRAIAKVMAALSK